MSDNFPVVGGANNLPSKRELREMLNNLTLSADAKILMGEVLDTTAQVGGGLVEIGRHILNFIMDLCRRYQATTLGVIVSLTISMLVNSIPILGLLLGPLVAPIMAVFMISAGALTDMRNSSIEKQIELFGAKLDAVLTRG